MKTKKRMKTWIYKVLTQHDMDMSAVSAYLPPILGFWPKWVSIHVWIGVPSGRILVRMVVARPLGRRRSSPIIGRLLIWRLPLIRGLDRIIRDLPSSVLLLLGELSQVCVKLLLSEGPSFPVIKVKQNRCRRKNNTLGLNSSPTNLEKSYFIR